MSNRETEAAELEARRYTRARFLQATAGAAAGTGLLGLAGLRVPSAHAATIEDLGRPYSSFLVLDTALGRDAAGAARLYASTYVVSDEGVYFFAVDPVTGSVTKRIHLTGTWGNYHIAAAPDGKIFVGSHTAVGPAHLWQYDPDADEIHAVATVASEAIFYGIAIGEWSVGPGGSTSQAPYKVYVGAYPSGKVYEYDPSAGTFADLGAIVPGNRYAKAVLTLPGARVLVGTGTPANLTVLDVASGSKTVVLPEQYRGYSFAYNADLVGDNVFVKVVVPDSRELRFDVDDLSFLGEVPGAPGGSWGPPVFSTMAGPGEPNKIYVAGAPAGGQTGIWLHNLSDGHTSLANDDTSWSGTHVWWTEVDDRPWTTSIAGNGIFGRWSPKDGGLVKRQLPLPGAPKEICVLGLGPDGRIYGDTYEGDVLYAVDPQSADVEILGRLANGHSGESLAMATADGKLFSAAYTGAILAVYDPTKPWSPGTDADSNPRNLGTLGEQQYRPEDAVVGSDGRVYVATWAAYGQLGGALTAVDPATYAMTSWRSLGGDHNLHSLEAGDGEIYVGTSRYGDGIDASGWAKLLVVDQAAGTTSFEAVPVPGAGIVTSLAQAPDGRVFGGTDVGSWFTFDPETRTVTQLGGFPLGLVRGLITGPDGMLYGTGPSSAFRIDPATNAVATVGAGGGRFYRALTFDADGRFYWAAGANLLRMTP